MKFLGRGVIVVVGALTLIACGGGGGGGGGTTPTTPTSPMTPTTPEDPLGEIGSKEDEQLALFGALAADVLGLQYEALSDGAAVLDGAIGTFCADPASGDLALVQTAWREAMDAWQTVQALRVGPTEDDNIRFRMQFYPDPNSAVINNVDQVMTNGQPITTSLIANSPVGAQGFPALEYLLYEIGGFDDATDGQRRCDFIGAIGGNLVDMADSIAAEWADGGDFREAFAAANDVFTEGDDVLVAILEAFALQAETMADRKINSAVNAGDSELLESAYSETSLENLLANHAGLVALYDDDDEATYRLRDYMVRQLQLTSVAEQLDTALSEALVAMNALDGSLKDIIDGQATGDLEAIHDPLQDVADLILDVAVEADVNLGFNNADGDGG
ncbi:MAG: imelysin family protein [Pseudomonadota bacterium]